MTEQQGRFAPFGGFSILPEETRPGEPLFRFGVIADPQYADREPILEWNRYFRESPRRLAEAIAELNRHDLQFVVTLGDIIDSVFSSFDEILPLYAESKHPLVFLLGNHDYDVEAPFLAQVPGMLGLQRTYYDFAGGGYRFIVIDGNDVSLFGPAEGDPRRALAGERMAALAATGAINANPWNGSLSETQFDWLERTARRASAAGEKIIVFSHYPVHPVGQHNLWDSEQVVALLTGIDGFVAYFCGHNHVGSYAAIGRQHFLNFKGMVDTPDSNTFAIVEVFADRIEILGFGREDSRTLPL